MAAFCSVRFSWGKFTTDDDIDYALEQTKEVVTLLREITLPEEIGVCDENCPCFFESAGLAGDDGCQWDGGRAGALRLFVQRAGWHR